MTKMATYRALKPCIAGGSFRRPGEVFAAPAYDPAPPHLVEVAESADLTEPDEPAGGTAASTTKTRKTASKAKAAAQGPGPAELGLENTAISSSEVTSADIIKD